MPRGIPNPKPEADTNEPTVNMRIKRISYKDGGIRYATTGFFPDPEYLPDENRNADGNLIKRKIGPEDVITVPKSVAEKYLDSGVLELCL